MRPPRGPSSASSERDRLIGEQADKIAMENAVSRREYVHVEDVAAVLEPVILAIKAKIQGMGSKISPHVVAVNSTPEVKAIIDAHGDEILREIAAIDARGFGVTREPAAEASAVGDAPAPYDRKRVGRRPPAAVARVKRRTRRVGHVESGVPAGNP